MFQCSHQQQDFAAGRIAASLAPSRRVGSIQEKVYLFPAKKNKQSSQVPSLSGPTNGSAMFDGQSVEVSNVPTAIPAPISSPSSPSIFSSSASANVKPSPSSFQILPAGWLKKHLEVLPSHVLVVVTFDPSLPHNNWTQMEINVQDLVENTRQSLSGRDSKVHLVVLKLQGTKLATASMSPADLAALKQLESERLASLKNRCGLSSALFTTLASTTDIDVNHVTLKKLFATCKAASKQYYLSYARRYKKREKALGDDVVSLASGVRFSYKVASFYEFLNNTEKAMKWYQNSYDYFVPLCRAMLHTSSPSLKLPPDAFDQVRGGADWINYKLVSYALQEAAEANAAANAKNILPPDKAAAEASLDSALSAAVAQWRLHASLFINRYREEGRNGAYPQSRWSFHAFVFKQRSVMGVLTEKLSKTGFHDCLSQNGMYCGAPWSHYWAAAAALLQMHKSGDIYTCTAMPGGNDYNVGGSGELGKVFAELKSTDVLNLALTYIGKALALLAEGGGAGREQQACRLNHTASLIHSSKGQWAEAAKHARMAVEIVDEAWAELACRVGYQLLICKSKLQEDVGVLALQLLINPCAKHLGPRQLEKVNSLLTKSDKMATYSNGRDAPVSFCFTFPVLYAIAGDTVRARLAIRSNAVGMKSLDITSLSVKMDFESRPIKVDLGAEGLKLESGATKVVGVSVPVPSSLGNRRGSLQAGGLSPTTSKVEKPLNSGFTRAGGACLIKENSDVDDVLGGAPIGCESLTFTLSSGHRLVVVDEKDELTPEEVNLRPKQDYLTHTWPAASEVGVRHGPAILRVHGPLAQLRVEDITSVNTDGKALDGAVYRVVLKVTAGLHELCKNIEMETSCANAFRSNEEQDISPEHRRAMLVEAGEASDGNDNGTDFAAPPGWRALGEDGSGTTEPVPIAEVLEPGGVAYVAVHLYRPPPTSAGDPATADRDQCTTEYEVVFSYTQILRGGKEKEVRRRCQGFLEWGEPLRTSLSLGKLVDSGFPAGISHPSNAAKPKEGDEGSWESASAGRGESGGACVVSDQPAKVRCTFVSAMPTMPAKLETVSFGSEGGVSSGNGGTSVQIVEAAGRKGVLYEGSGDLASLKEGARIGVSYVVTPHTSGNPVKTNLGSIKVRWRPLPMALPEGIDVRGGSGISVDKGLHGPLPSAIGAEIKVKNPTAIIERAPFDVNVDIPSEARLGESVEVTVRIKNKVKEHQRLSLEMKDDPDVYVSGRTKDEIMLNGFKGTELKFEAFFLKAGSGRFPKLALVDVKNKRFLVSNEAELPVYVHSDI